MDKFYKGMFFNNQLSVSVLQTTEMVNEAIKIHNLTPVCAAALGRTLTVCTFMSQGLKNKTDKLSVTINGDGLGGKIRLIVSAAAPIDPEVGNKIEGLGIYFIQGYGLTETSPLATLVPDTQRKLGSVGKEERVPR